MSYDANGHNSYQDILDEIERVRLYKQTYKTEKPLKTKARPRKRGNRDGRQ